jgi:hypothetical protein
MKVLIRPIFHHVLKTAACFPLNLRPSLSMLQCSKWLDLEAFGLYDPGPAATFPPDQDLFSWPRPTVLTCYFQVWFIARFESAASAI